jgi:hypothetical protein
LLPASPSFFCPESPKFSFVSIYFCLFSNFSKQKQINTNANCKVRKPNIIAFQKRTLWGLIPTNTVNNNKGCAKNALARKPKRTNLARQKKFEQEGACLTRFSHRFESLQFVFSNFFRCVKRFLVATVFSLLVVHAPLFFKRPVGVHHY